MFNFYKHFGCGTPTNVYANAMTLLAKANHPVVHRPTFTVERDLCRLYVKVGYETVFECSIKNCNPPIVYKYGAWVTELDTLVKSWRRTEQRIAKGRP